MRRVLKVLGVVVAMQALLYLVGMVLKAMLARRAGDADPLGDEFDLVNVMEGTEFSSHARTFRAGTIQNIMGGVDVDLTEADLAPGGAVLQVTTVMGGTEIAVPRGWRVILRGQAFAGAHELAGTPEDDLDDNSPVLTIEARTVMGALDVRAAPSRVSAL